MPRQVNPKRAAYARVGLTVRTRQRYYSAGSPNLDVGLPMDPAHPSPLRIYRDGLPDEGGTDAHVLACRELLRPATGRPAHRELEPLSRGWFEELEFKRYAGPGAWLRRVLEFSRHPGESLVMFGPGVGSDAVQYQRHGTQVTVCATPSDDPDMVRKNFELRGQSVRVVTAGPDSTAPFERWSFDLAYLNALHVCPDDLPGLVSEVYRVLKPGGKVFTIVRAKYDAGYWQDILLPFHHWYRPTVPLSDGPRFSARGLKQTFADFAEHRVGKRHVRRGSLPYLWRFLPRSVLERAVGQVLVLRAFKPVTTALDAIAA
jgi:SAM-dependent methyltransferase